MRSEGTLNDNGLAMETSELIFNMINFAHFLEKL